MDISIIICSYNRAHNLPECFDHLLQLEGTENIQWEIILVDNNSTDETSTVTQRYADQSTLDIRYIFEGQQGVVFARNKGIEVSKGKYIVYIDDDIRVTPKWLRTIHDTFKEFDCDAIGGRIQIESQQPLPKWITPELYGFLGHQDFGSNPRQIDGYKEYPFGGNMAIKRRAFSLIGQFDIRVGRKGDASKKEGLFKGEEPDFFHRLANNGGTFRYHPDILVSHKILPYQLKKGFFLTLHNNAGILEAQLNDSHHNRTLMGVPLFIFPQIFRSIGKFIYQTITQGPNRSFRKLMNVAYFAGVIQGYYAKSR